MADADALAFHDKNDRNRAHISTIVGAISAVAVAISLLYNFGILPLQEQMKNAIALRESDRREIRDIYSTIGSLSGFKDLANAKFEHLQKQITGQEEHLLLVDQLARDRAAPIASIAQIDLRLSRLTDRFNETQQKLSPSIADEIKEMRNELRDIRKSMIQPNNSEYRK